MRCPLEEQLSAYMDDELKEDERQQVEAHVQSCEPCQALLANLFAIQSDVAQTFHQIPEPADLAMRVLRSLGSEKLPAAAARVWLFVPVTALLALLVWYLTGAVIVKLLSSFIKLLMAMVYMASHFISSVPVLSALTVVLSLMIIMASVYSLRRLFQITTG